MKYLYILSLFLSLCASQIFQYDSQTIPVPPGLYTPPVQSFAPSPLNIPSASLFPNNPSPSFQEYNPEQQMNFMESQNEIGTDAMTANVLLSQAEELINRNREEENSQVLESDFAGASEKNVENSQKEQNQKSLQLENVNLSQGLVVGAVNITANGTVLPPNYPITIGNQTFVADDIVLAINFAKKFGKKIVKLDYLFKEVPNKDGNDNKNNLEVASNLNAPVNLKIAHRLKKNPKNIDENRFLQLKAHNKKKSLSKNKYEQYADLDISNSIDLETEKKTREVQDAVRTVINDANKMNSYDE
jgi:hypothetical protein